MKERPRILDGKTVKIKTGLGAAYITVTELDSKPFEVFISIGRSGKSVTAKAEAIGRLCSLLLRSDVPVEQIIKQLDGISGENMIADGDSVTKSLPDAVAKVLHELYKKEPGL